MNIHDQRQIFRRNPLFSTPTVPSASQETILHCSPINAEPREQFVIPDFWNPTERFVWSENKGRLKQTFTLTTERSTCRRGPSQRTDPGTGVKAGQPRASASRGAPSTSAGPWEMSPWTHQECGRSPCQICGFSWVVRQPNAPLPGWQPWSSPLFPVSPPLHGELSFRNPKNSFSFVHFSPDPLHRQAEEQLVIA